MMPAAASAPDPDATGQPGTLMLGVVSAVDLSAATVTIAAGDVQTGPIPFACQRAGSTRVWSPPSVGEQMMLFLPEGDIARAVAFGSISFDDFPPIGDSLRELIGFSDGAQLAYDPEAHVLDVMLPDGATLNILSDGGISIDVGSASVAITGDVTIDGTLTCTGDVIADGKSLKNHRHTGVTAGVAQSGPPA